jgi:glycosyltransferase involved in cell wall biosynthesis
MRVGIDAKWYFEGPPSGIMVIKNLVNELSKVDSNFEFYFFLDRKSKNINLDYETEKLNKIYIWAGNSLLSNLFIIPYYINKHKIDVFIYQNFGSFIGRHKKIIFIHDLIFLTHTQYYSLTERLYLKFLKPLAKFSDLIITISESEKNRMKMLGLSKKIEVIHHGIDPIFKPKNQLNKSVLYETKLKYNLPDTYILYVGRLNTRKNVPNLIKAFSQLSNNKYPLVLVGNKDWKTDNIDKLIQELNIENKVIQTGSVSLSELSSIYSLAKIFCFLSFEEGFGLPPLEAMASGIPIIVSNTSSLPEVCGQAGTYVNANKPNEIAFAIDKLLSDDQLYHQKSIQGSERSKEFTWVKSADKLINILENKYGSK